MYNTKTSEQHPLHCFDKQKQEILEINILTLILTKTTIMNITAYYNVFMTYRQISKVQLHIFHGDDKNMKPANSV